MSLPSLAQLYPYLYINANHSESNYVRNRVVKRVGLLPCAFQVDVSSPVELFLFIVFVCLFCSLLLLFGAVTVCAFTTEYGIALRRT